MLAFACNSLLCRMALGGGAIDAASFTAIRFGSGALALLILAAASGTGRFAARGGSWLSAAVLFVYAFPFAFAYARLTTGTGALVLFGATQITMIAAGLRAGERPALVEWIGVAIAVAGLLWLVTPGLSTSPSPAGGALMFVAGIAWGAYSLLGRGSTAPMADVTGTFLRLTPLTLGVVAAGWSSTHVSSRGVTLAALSGAVTSGGGYVIWYYALRRLTAMRASIVQLSIPALAALAGVVALDEPITVRLVTAAALILGGVALSIGGRTRLGPSFAPAPDRGQ
jgi:drug/metabolite transporter (DMT)-like permease